MTTDNLLRIDKDMLNNSFAIRELAEGMRRHSVAIIALSVALLFCSLLAHCFIKRQDDQLNKLHNEFQELKEEIHRANEDQAEISAFPVAGFSR